MVRAHTAGQCEQALGAHVSVLVAMVRHHASQVALSVAIDIERPNHSGPLDRGFEANRIRPGRASQARGQSREAVAVCGCPSRAALCVAVAQLKPL
jgi:hypothetical protein